MLHGDQNRNADGKPCDQWYDYPYYYDLGFQDETEREVRFFQAAFQRFGAGEVKRILEPGCGTGRLVHRLAQLGFEVSGFDLNRAAIDFLKQRLKRDNLSAEVFEADMARFDSHRTFDAAINTINTFRHLLTEDDALNHLQSVAASLRKGGLFILGLHVMPFDADDQCTERWRASDGRADVCYTLRVLHWNQRTRIERLRISMLIRENGHPPRRLRAEMELRTYRAIQLRKLLAKVPQLQLVESFDFWYEIDEPFPLDRDTCDVVLVMRKVK